MPTEKNPISKKIWTISSLELAWNPSPEDNQNKKFQPQKDLSLSKQFPQFNPQPVLKIKIKNQPLLHLSQINKSHQGFLQSFNQQALETKFWTKSMDQEADRKMMISQRRSLFQKYSKNRKDKRRK